MRFFVAVYHLVGLLISVAAGRFGLGLPSRYSGRSEQRARVMAGAHKVPSVIRTDTWCWVNCACGYEYPVKRKTMPPYKCPGCLHTCGHPWCTK